MRRYIYLATLLTIGFIQGYAEVTFRAAAPGTVINGQQFQLSFTVNDAEAKNFRGPSFSDFDVKFGPTSATNMSTRIFNNQMVKESSITFTYILQAKKEGTFKIDPATVTVDGKTYTSSTVSIKVVPPDKNAPAQSSPGVNIQRSESLGNSSATSQEISPQDLYLRTVVSKHDVYEQECIVASIKLYTRYEHTGTDGTGSKLPDFEGFLMQDIELPQNKSWQIENINGLNYKTVVLRQYILYPQRSGTLTIESAKLDAVVGILRPQRSFFGSSMQEVKKTLISPPVKINVRALPTANKPASFSGGVGDFTLTSSLTPDQPKSNEAVTLKMTFKGTGNLKLLKNPEIKFPADFEVYDPKVDNNFQATTSGYSGSKTIEYLMIPRHAGNFVIPSVEFSYFDLKSGSYKTIQTPEYKLQVEKGADTPSGMVSNYTNQENVRMLGEDIRFIKTGNSNQKKAGSFIFGSGWYYLWYILPALAFAVLFIIFRKQAKENANLALVRNKKANKVANKRLKKAALYLKENKKEAFYEETLRALWGYLSDKLNMSVAQLSKDNVEASLTNYGVDQPLTKEFLDIIHTCEFARYAPVGENNSMEKVYRQTTEAINKMENTIKKNTNKNMDRI
ncbi:MAG: BatD family protein [Candidatus Azobacteroides sp.]|nr:BatD family protein [Candidatus Azobacteroides sp.]